MAVVVAAVTVDTEVAIPEEIVVTALAMAAVMVAEVVVAGDSAIIVLGVCSTHPHCSCRAERIL